MTITTVETALYARRIDAGLTRRELAQRAQCSPATVQLVEQGWMGAKPETVRRIETALNMK